MAATFVLMLSGGAAALGILWNRASEQRDIARDVARTAHQIFQRISGEIDDRVATLGPQRPSPIARTPSAPYL